MYTSDVQVQLRFAPVEKITEDIKDMYPPCLVVRLNAKMIQLPVSHHLSSVILSYSITAEQVLPCRISSLCEDIILRITLEPFLIFRFFSSCVLTAFDLFPFRINT